MAGTPKTVTGAGEGLAKDNDGRGERDRAGVDVENVKSRPGCRELCSAW